MIAVCILFHIRFLREQYYQHFTEEVEIPDLLRHGILLSHDALTNNVGVRAIATATEDDRESEAALPALPPAVLRKRLEMFLQVFSCVSSPRQLFQHQLLHELYTVYLSKTDSRVANLSFDCILAYKNAAITPFKEVLKGFLDDGKIRNQLATFDPSVSGLSEATQRAEIIPLVQRILFGKFSSKPRGGRAQRDQNLSR